MKKLILGLVLFLFAGNVSGQSGWVQMDQTITQGNFTGVHFINELTGWVKGPNLMLKTTDGGINWSSIYSPGNVGTIHAFDESNIIVTFGTSIYRTTNGGVSYSNPYNTAFYGVLQLNFLNSQIGWATSYDGVIARTDNAGISWYNPGISGVGIDFIDPSTGWLLKYTITTGETKILTTTNGGGIWTTYNMNNMAGIIKFLNPQTGFICGNSGIMKSTNGGINWFSVYSNSQIFTLKFINVNTGWFTKTNAVIRDSSITKTTNGGITWIVDTVFNVPITAINFVNQYTGWAVGNNGRIYKTSSGGNTFAGNNSSSVSDYNLSQNYPNPFNPSTIINYQITINSVVTLKVFDLLGKEVATLVNEKQTPGSYAVDFNSTEFNLPSGIYFYTLNAGEFKETKKMVLVK